MLNQLVDEFFNYTIITVTIRFAQEIGLHRAETYNNLDLEEATKRRKIWWFCYFSILNFLLNPVNLQ